MNLSPQEASMRVAVVSDAEIYCRLDRTRKEKSISYVRIG